MVRVSMNMKLGTDIVVEATRKEVLEAFDEQTDNMNPNQFLIFGKRIVAVDDISTVIIG